MSNTRTRTVTRTPRFKEGFDAESGIRQTKVTGKKGGPQEKTSEGHLEGITIELKLPTEFTELMVPAKGDRQALPYQLYQLPINDGYISVNALFGADGGQYAGTTVRCKADIKKKTIRQKGRPPFEVYYLKLLELTDQPVDHSCIICPHDLALEDQIEQAGGDAIVFELNELNAHHQGGIIVKPL